MGFMYDFVISAVVHLLIKIKLLLLMKESYLKIFHLCLIFKMIKIQLKIQKQLLEVKSHLFQKIGTLKIHYKNLGVIQCLNIIQELLEIKFKKSIFHMIMLKFQLNQK
ncbi:unnamed protein product [Paramecium sonneborni]|uniref:Uncharacterized protein n=1 Tax=Paramecium sonneborni TaxID=65129 RepID=A0A8S1KE42_9CILI|nr:unnamed protein product [Paramecium sonneborni]